MRNVTQKVHAVVYRSSHTTPEDARRFLAQVAKEDANVVALPTPFNVAAFNRMKRGEEVEFGTRYSEHDFVLIEGLLNLFRRKKGKFAVVQLKEPQAQPTSFQLKEREEAQLWRRRGWEKPAKKLEEPRQAALRMQEQLHSTAGDLGKVIRQSLKGKGVVDEQEIARRLRNQVTATLIRREMLRRAMLDLPTSIHQQSSVLATLPKLKVVVQVSGTYAPSAVNAEEWLNRPGPRQGSIDYNLEFKGSREQPILTRTRVVDDLIERQHKLMRKIRAPPPVMAPYYYTDKPIATQIIHRIVFEELLERALRLSIKDSTERFETVTKISRGLRKREISRFVTKMLPSVERDASPEPTFVKFLKQVREKYGKGKDKLGKKVVGAIEKAQSALD